MYGSVNQPQGAHMAHQAVWGPQRHRSDSCNSKPNRPNRSIAISRVDHVKASKDQACRRPPSVHWAGGTQITSLASLPVVSPSRVCKGYSGAVAAMEVEQQQPQVTNLQLSILATIKSAQLQNGLKHGDFSRYRWVDFVWCMYVCVGGWLPVLCAWQGRVAHKLLRQLPATEQQCIRHSTPNR